MRVGGFLFGLLMIVVLGIAALVYVPVISDCNARHGEVVKNWAGWPVCINTDR